jgi:hypothetical protein
LLKLNKSIKIDDEPYYPESSVINIIKQIQKYIASQSSVEVTDEIITNAFCETRDEDIKMKLDYRDRDYFQAGCDFAIRSRHPAQSLSDEQIEKYFLVDEPRGYGCSYYKGMVDGAKAYRDGTISEWLKQNKE